MNTKTAMRWMLHERRLPGIALLCLAGLALAHYGAEYPSEVHHKLRAAAEAVASCFEAGFIAAFLALVVDPVLKQQLVGDSLLQVMFRFAYGYSMPDEVQQFWEERVVKEEFIRKKVSIHWHLCPSTTSRDRMEVQMHMKFQPVNFTSKKLSYKHTVFATSDTPDETGRVDSMYCQSDHADEEYYFRNEAELNQHRGEIGYVGNAISLQPLSVLRKGLVCGAHYKSEGAVRFGTDRVTFTQFSADVRVTVTVDDALAELKVSLIPHPVDQTGLQTPKRSPKYDSLCSEWDFRQRLFIPNERLVLRWEVQAKEFPGSPSASPSDVADRAG